MLKIKTVEIKKTSSGKPYKALTFEDGKKVNMWANDNDYTNATEGAELSRTLEQDGQYLKLNDTKPKKKGGFAKYKEGQIKEAQERKEQSISRTLDRKEESIMLTSTARDATLMVTALLSSGHVANQTAESLKAKWENWRKYFVEQYTKDITRLTAPFN